MDGLLDLSIGYESENRVILEGLGLTKEFLDYHTIPRPADTWWKIGTNQPVFIASLEKEEIGHHDGFVVCYKDEGLAKRTELSEFLKTFSFSPPVPSCKVGEEWFNNENVILRVKEIRPREVIGSTHTNPRMIVPIAVFAASYKLLVRKSIYDCILADDEDP
jgi:hypothetical protein